MELFRLATISQFFRNEVPLAEVIEMFGPSEISSDENWDPKCNNIMYKTLGINPSHKILNRREVLRSPCFACLVVFHRSWLAQVVFQIHFSQVIPG